MKERVKPQWIFATIGVLSLVVASCGSLVVQPEELGAPAQPGAPAPAGGQVPTTLAPSLATGVPSVSAATPAAGGGGGSAPPGTSVNVSRACRGGATDVGVTSNSIKIAQIVSITGPLPGAFNNAIDAVDAYFKLVNQNGGICGRKVQLIVEDDGADPTTNRIKAEKLAREDKVFGFVGSFAVGDQGMAAVINKFKVPDIGFPLSWDRGLSPYAFGVPGKTNRRITVEGKYASAYLNKVNGIKQIAVFWTNTETSFVNAWSAEAGMLKASGGTIRICHEQETSTTDVNFNQYVLSMAGNCTPTNGPIGVYTTMENNANIRLARAMRDQGFQWKVFAPTTTSYDPSFITDAQGATEGAYVAVPTIPFERYPRHPELKLFVDTVKRYHPNAKLTAFGSYMWGAAALFTKVASECGGNLTRACVTPKLQKMGPFSDNGFLAPNEPRAVHLFQCDLVTQIRNGRFVELTKPAGAKGPPGGEEFWDCGSLLDWFQYYCAHKKQFPSLDDRESYVKGFVKNC